MCIVLFLGSTSEFAPSNTERSGRIVELRPIVADHLQSFVGTPFLALMTTNGGNCCCDFQGAFGSFEERAEEQSENDREELEGSEAERRSLMAALADLIARHGAATPVTVVACWDGDFGMPVVERGTVALDEFRSLSLMVPAFEPQRYAVEL